jgi:hypothetical protein
VYVDDLTAGNNVEEAEFFYHTKPKPFKTADFAVNMAHKTEGLWNVVEIKFKPEILIPAKGMIEVEF